MSCGAVSDARLQNEANSEVDTKSDSQRQTYIRHRPTAVIYMVAAERSLVGRESLHKLPTLNFAIADFKVKLMANDFGKVVHSADRAEHIGRVNDLDRTLFRFLTGTANQPFKGHAVEHNVIIVNLTVRTISRGKVTGFALNANNLIQHFFSLFPLGLFLCFVYCQHSFCTFRSGSRSCGLCQDYKTLGMDTMTIDCLDRDTIRRYRQRMDNLRPGHVWSELAVEDFLHRIGAMARDADGKLCPTAAGLLMFGHEYEIVREFPHYFLDYQEHDRSATEDERWTDRIVSSSGDWSGNICDFYFRVYNRVTQDIKVPFKLEGTDRIDDTPLHKALREALANALIHADYYDRRGLVIQKWPDKIRIANPGAFRINVQEALVGGVSDPRNESLIKMFNLINVGERAGSGLPSIRTVWQKQGWQEPEIVESFNPDRTTLVLPLAANKVAAKSGDKKVAESLSPLPSSAKATYFNI